MTKSKIRGPAAPTSFAERQKVKEHEKLLGSKFYSCCHSTDFWYLHICTDGHANAAYITFVCIKLTTYYLVS